MHARVLKFHVWIPHEKISDTYIFPCQDYAPFLSYVPLKKYGCKQNILKTTEARALKFKE